MPMSKEHLDDLVRRTRTCVADGHAQHEHQRVHVTAAGSDNATGATVRAAQARAGLNAAECLAAGGSPR